MATELAQTFASCPCYILYHSGDIPHLGDIGILGSAVQRYLVSYC